MHHVLFTPRAPPSKSDKEIEDSYYSLIYDLNAGPARLPMLAELDRPPPVNVCYGLITLGGLTSGGREEIKKRMRFEGELVMPWSCVCVCVCVEYLDEWSRG